MILTATSLSSTPTLPSNSGHSLCSLRPTAIQRLYKTLQDGPDKYTMDDLDELFCVRHKERDYVWIVKHKLYKKTFENKHSHVYRSRLVGRNPGFDFTHVQMCISYTLSTSQLSFLEDRLSSLSC